MKSQLTRNSTFRFDTEEALKCSWLCNLFRTPRKDRSQEWKNCTLSVFFEKYLGTTIFLRNIGKMTRRIDHNPIIPNFFINIFKLFTVTHVNISRFENNFTLEILFYVLWMVVEVGALWEEPFTARYPCNAQHQSIWSEQWCSYSVRVAGSIQLYSWTNGILLLLWLFHSNLKFFRTDEKDNNGGRRLLLLPLLLLCNTWWSSLRFHAEMCHDSQFMNGRMEASWVNSNLTLDIYFDSSERKEKPRRERNL